MDQKILDLRKLAFKKISKLKFTTKQDREDFAQDFVMRYLEGKAQKQALKYGIIDFFRRSNPLSRVKGGKKPDDLDNFKKKEIDNNLLEDPSHTDSRLGNRLDAVRMLNKMPREDRILFILRFYFEFSFPELTLIFGISENALQKKVRDIEDCYLSS